jgi:hypothetical protein
MEPGASGMLDSVLPLIQTPKPQFVFQKMYINTQRKKKESRKEHSKLLAGVLTGWRDHRFPFLGSAFPYFPNFLSVK